MPATSKSQQRLFGIVHGCQKSDKKKSICKSPKIKDLTKSVSEKDAEDFASTKHEDLPEKVEEGQVLKFKKWMNCQIDENRNRTGLKFGYPDGYYRSQYPGLYSTPISATAALDLENERMMPRKNRENKSGIPDVVKKPVGMISFPENTSFSNWLSKKGLNENQEENMNNKKCNCKCDGCKKGDCKNCSCENCSCKNCTCNK
jgi:hypothetical protein